MCVRSGCEDVAECVEGCCGVRGRMLRSVCGHGAEPMRRACGAYRRVCECGFISVEKIHQKAG